MSHQRKSHIMEYTKCNTYIIILQYTATLWHALQQSATRICISLWWDLHAATRCNTLQQTATNVPCIHVMEYTRCNRTRCNTLQHTATHIRMSHVLEYACYDTIQFAATNYETMQHTFEWVMSWNKQDAIRLLGAQVMPVQVHANTKPTLAHIHTYTHTHIHAYTHTHTHA